MIDATEPLTPNESDFAGQHHGLVRRGDTWYRLKGWGTARDWESLPLVRVPDDHAQAILQDDLAKDAMLEVLAWYYDQIHDGTGAPHAIGEVERTYASLHGVSGAREVSEFIESAIAEAS